MDMGPAYTANNAMDRVRYDAILARQGNLCDARSVPLANTTHVGCCELCRAATFAECEPALRERIAHVVLLGSEEQVIRPHACGCVAAVAQRQAGRDRTFSEGPAVPMSEHLPLVPDAGNAVAMPIPRAAPKPAAPRLPHLGPERDDGISVPAGIAAMEPGALRDVAMVNLELASTAATYADYHWHAWNLAWGRIPCE